MRKTEEKNRKNRIESHNKQQEKLIKDKEERVKIGKKN